VGGDDGENRIGRIQSFVQTPRKQDIGNMIANIDDDLVFRITVNLLQAL